MPEISKRKLESYERAEKVCRELRFQVAKPGITRPDLNRSIDLLIKWMDKTGKIKFERP